MHKIFKIPIDVTTSILFTTKDTNAKQSLVEYISSSKRQDFKTSKNLYREGDKIKNSSFPDRSSLRYFGFISNLRQAKALHRMTNY